VPKKLREPFEEWKMGNATIHMPLLDEGTPAWTKIAARHLGNSRYRILGIMPTEEKWAYAPGAIVRCESKIFAGGASGLVPVENLKP
jgi:hypothetical protein